MNTRITLNNQVSYSIQITRVLATLSIFICHAVQIFDSPVIKSTGQLFNVGVPIFFMISGLIFSTREKPKSTGKWLKKRFIRILVPYYIIMALVLIAFFVYDKVNGKSLLDYIMVVNFPTSVIPVEGIFERYIPGCEHWWFITDMLICYLLTPVFYKLREKFVTSKKSFLLIMFSCYIAVILTAAFILPSTLCTLIVSIFSFMIGFFFIPYIYSLKKYIFLIGIIVAVMLRILGSKYIGQSLFYNNFFAPILHQLLGISLFCVCLWLFGLLYNKLIKAKAVVSFFDKISYEFYLVHNFFFTGFFIITVFNVKLLDILLVLIISIMLAWCVNLVSGKIVKLLSKPQIKD